MGSCFPRTTNWPLSGRGLGDVTNFEILGPLDISQTDKATLFEFGTQTEPGQFYP